MSGSPNSGVINDEMQNRYLCFALDNEKFAIEIKYVTEIVGILPITVVPEIPEHIKGIINLRGKVVPVIDLRLKFKKEPMEYNDRTCIIIVELEDICVGFIVDNVNDVLTISDDEISPPPDYKTGVQNRYLSGVGILPDKVVLLLDCIKILTADDVDQLLQLNTSETENN